MIRRDGLNRCTGCGCPEADCPISDDNAEWTTDANGNHDGLCCEDCWHPNDQPSLQEITMSALKDKLTALVDALKAEGHHLAQLAEDALAHLKGDEATIQHEAEADATQVAKDTETAAKPVVAEAEADAAKLEGEAAAAVAKDVTPPAAS